MRWLVSAEWAMVPISRLGMWQPLQLFDGVWAKRWGKGVAQLWFVWQLRHLSR